MIIGTVVLATGLISVAITSCGRHHGKLGNHEMMEKYAMWKVDYILDDVEATDAQRSVVTSAAQTILSDIKHMKANHHEQHETVLAELEKEQPDKKKLHAMLDAKFDEVRAFGHRSLDTALSAYIVLTPEQRADLLADLKDRCTHH